MLYYLNPGNPIYDATVEIVLSEYKEEVLKGTILVSPEESDPYFAYFVRSQITDKTKKQNIVVSIGEIKLTIFHHVD